MSYALSLLSLSTRTARHPIHSILSIEPSATINSHLDNSSHSINSRLSRRALRQTLSILSFLSWTASSGHTLDTLLERAPIEIETLVARSTTQPYCSEYRQAKPTAANRKALTPFRLQSNKFYRQQPALHHHPSYHLIRALPSPSTSRLFRLLASSRTAADATRLVFLHLIHLVARLRGSLQVLYFDIVYHQPASASVSSTNQPIFIALAALSGPPPPAAHLLYPLVFRSPTKQVRSATRSNIKHFHHLVCFVS